MGIWGLALHLALAAGPAPVDGCAAAERILQQAAPSPDGTDLARACSGVLSLDLPRTPSLQAALDRLAAAHSAAEATEARSALAATLDAVCSIHTDRLAAPPSVDRAALQVILARPQFSRRTAGGPRLTTVLERLWDVIKEALYTSGWSSFSTFSRTAFLVAVLLATAWLALRVLLRPKESAPLLAPAAWREVHRASEAELLREAALARAQGDFPRVLALEMAAVRVAWSNEGLASDLAALTDREWLAALRERGPSLPQLPALAALALQFEQLFYGASTIDRATSEAFQREAEALRRARGAFAS
jgi:hypothetical protein